MFEAKLSKKCSQKELQSVSHESIQDKESSLNWEVVKSSFQYFLQIRR